MALADDTSPVFVARGMNAFASMFMDMDKIKAAYQGDGGLSWGDHHPCLFSGTEWFFRTGYRASLATEWIPALDGVDDKLRSGAKVADVGCGHGASVVVMAAAYPKSKFWGFDFHAPSIETSRARASEAGVSKQTTFEVAAATSYDGTSTSSASSTACTTWATRSASRAMRVSTSKPTAPCCSSSRSRLDSRAENIGENPMAALLYTASSAICTPNSLSQDVGLGLGAQAGPRRLLGVFSDAGFTHFRVAAETPMNLIIEARPVETSGARARRRPAGRRVTRCLGQGVILSAGYERSIMP